MTGVEFGLASIARLLAGPARDVTVYLDERGTAAADCRLVTGGILVHGVATEVAAAWERLWQDRGWRGKKGRDLTEVEMLDVAEFLVAHPVLPVSLFSVLDDEELDRLRAFARRFERSQSRLKRFKKISGASWLWKHQMSQTLAYAEASFLVFEGPIRHGTLWIDEMHEEPRKREHYKQLLTRHSESSRLAFVAEAFGVPDRVKALLASSVPQRWQIEMTAKGPLAKLADVCCAMFGHYVEGRSQKPWDVVLERHRQADRIPPCLGSNVTPNVRAWLEVLYERGDPNRYSE